MKNIVFPLLILSCIAVSSCRNSGYQLPPAPQGEGSVVYRISYPDTNLQNQNYLLPNETNLFFRNTKASFITSLGGLAEIVNLLDNDRKKYTTLLNTILGQNLEFTDTPEDVKEQESNPRYEFEPTKETKTIAGLVCTKAIVNDVTNNRKFEIYFYPQMKVCLGDSPYKDFNYLLMEYYDTKNGLPLHLIASKVVLNHVDTTMLSPHGQYQQVDKKSLVSILLSLQSSIKIKKNHHPPGNE